MDLTVLVLLDLSTEFDRIDYKILKRLEQVVGMRGMALKWFKSYLSH